MNDAKSLRQLAIDMGLTDSEINDIFGKSTSKAKKK
jgi:protein-disulfide isomerase-like protein with CxxC motif